MCEKYIRSFVWIRNLYFNNQYNDWVYDSHYAPPLQHLIEYRDNGRDDGKDIKRTRKNIGSRLQDKNKYPLDYVLQKSKFIFYFENITPEIQFLLSNNLDLN